MNKTLSLFCKWGLISLALLLSSCSQKDNFYQSNAFYINDRERTLLSSTRYYIYAMSTELYKEDSQEKEFKDAKINGTQVVVATHVGPLDSVDSTSVFNKWKIGSNDMGLFLLLYFEENPTDEYLYNYLGMTIEIGGRLSGYISMARANNIYESTFTVNMENFFDDYDYALFSFYAAMMQEIYLKVYDYTSYDYDGYMESYAEDQYLSFSSYLPSESFNVHAISWQMWVLIGIGLILLGGSTPFLGPIIFSLMGNSGGGGKSGGYRHTK